MTDDITLDALAVLISRNSDWAAICDRQADELAEYIKNWYYESPAMAVPEKAELIELAARLRLRAIELRKEAE